MAATRQQLLAILAINDPQQKCAACLQLPDDIQCQPFTPDIDTNQLQLPGRPAKPQLVAPQQVRQRSMASAEGRATLIHALAHIELNAVNLGLDIVWRFPNMPAEFYADWISVAKDEARHFMLLRAHLGSLGFSYGDFPAHNGLWDMAEKTKDDVLARLAIVPRTLEARGLDASPLIRNKLASAGDVAGAAILDTILHDEIGHVAIGNRWYRWLCQQRGLDPITTYAELATRYQAPKLRGPFNFEARRAAGFEEAELDALRAPDPEHRMASISGRPRH